MRRLASFTLLLAVSCGRALEPTAPMQGLVVHEWGTYTSVQGSDGLTVDGLQHEEEALPAFVRQRSVVPTDPKGIEALPGPVNQKLETPVLYFYAPAAMEVTASVDFPGGIVSQWYPEAERYAPAVGQMAAIAGGHMAWRAQVRPSGAAAAMQAVPADSVWAPSRKVASALIAVDDAVEKFIFYRGLGKFEVPFRVEARADGLIDVVNDSDEPIEDVFLLRVHDAGGATIPLGRIAAHGAIRGVALPVEGKERNVDRYVDETMATVAAALERSGLYADEARAMVETWSRSYFRSPGLRVLYLAPRAWTDRLLPLSVLPQPQTVVRTLVGRVEVMTRGDEADLLLRARAAAGGGEADLVSSLGRFAEPRLRRVRSLTTDLKMIGLLDELVAVAAQSN